MPPDNIDFGLVRLDQIARDEYGTDFITAINDENDDRKIRRIARLAGIELKYPFAVARPLAGKSLTGALQEWELNRALTVPDKEGVSPFDGLKGNPSYELVLRIFEQLLFQRDPETGPDFRFFLLQNHSESTWFLAALRAAQPYLCEKKEKGPKKSASPEKLADFWEIAKAAADDLATEGLKEAIRPVCVALCALVPFLAGAPPAFTFGFSLVLVHFAKKGYCRLEIQTEIIQILRLYQNDWERR